MHGRENVEFVNAKNCRYTGQLNTVKEQYHSEHMATDKHFPHMLSNCYLFQGRETITSNRTRLVGELSLGEVKVRVNFMP